MNDDEDENNPDTPETISAVQAQVVVDQLYSLARAIARRPPHDAECGVSYEAGASYYHVDIHWHTRPPDDLNPDVDALLHRLLGDEDP